MNAKTCFDHNYKAYIDQQLYFINNIGKLLRKFIPNSTAKGITEHIQTLEDMTTWRSFTPSIHNILVSLVEVYLGMKFNELLAKNEKRKPYKNYMHMFQNRIKLKKICALYSLNKIDDRFSHQNLEKSAKVYLNCLGLNMHKFPAWKSLLVIFKRRHLFTHKAGIIDRKFRNEYNELIGKKSNKKIPLSNIGKMAYIEVSVLNATAQVIISFVDFLESKS